ncbi:hypothetical protein HQQ80_01200 [Microbacteriaceae bacterium VKM Ac-2855]|nr:hypothetical protein [Microbacteriaceae bacterium VKM Ac-2855]
MHNSTTTPQLPLVRSIGIMQIATTQNRVELIEAEIAMIQAKLCGFTDLDTGVVVPAAQAGYRDQLLANLDAEREALEYWTTLQGNQLAAVVRVP